MAKQFLTLLIASFVFANFIAEDHLVNAVATVKGTKGESNKKSTKNIDTESSQDLDVNTDNKEVDETRDSKALENSEKDKTNGLVINSEGEVGANDLNGDNGIEVTETSKGKSRKNKRRRGGKRRRNKERKERKTLNKDIHSTEELQERESNNVGEYEEAELIDTPTMSQESEQTEIETTSAKSNTPKGNRERPNKSEENKDASRRSGGNGARQRGRNGNGRRRGAGAKRSGASKKDRIARRQPGKAIAKGKPNEIKFNGFRLPKNNGDKAANKIGRNSRFGRNRH